MTIPLTGVWRFQIDAEDIGLKEQWHSFEYFANNWNRTKEVGVPHNWNAMPGLERFEGVAWYFKELRRPALGDLVNKECVLQFKGVNYHATVWWNGRKLGTHEGGFTPFEFSVPPPLIQATNIITVRVENIRKPDRLPAMNFDWFNWGGIHRAVQLGVYGPQRLIYAHIETTSLEKDFALLRVQCRVSAAQALHWQIFEGSKQVVWGKETLRGMKDTLRIKIPNPKVWDVGSPFLYEFVAILSNSQEEFRVKFGVRVVSVKGTQLILNGRPVKLRGVCLHEEQMPYGRPQLPVMRAKDVRDIHALGFNAIRSAHYPHDEALPQLCDEQGILLLEEIPVYHNCAFSNPKVFRVAAKMLKELIYRDFNHPSVITWSCGNEVPAERANCAKFMRQLMSWGRRLDTSRLVLYVSNRLTSDTTRRAADVNALNCYFGWYYLTTRQLSWFMDTVHALRRQGPWVITEFGADAKLGFRDRSPSPARSSEDYQAAAIAHTIRILNSKPYVAGWFIWIYRDFKSPQRMNQYQQGFNRKGLVSEINEPKLIARVLPKILNNIDQKLKVHFGTALLFGRLLKPLEKFICFCESWVEERVVKKWTSRYLSSGIETQK